MKIKLQLLTVTATVFIFNINAQPVINNTNGTIQHKQSISITGSNFGTKSPAAPWLYDSFEEGTINTSIPGNSTPIGNHTYSYYYTNDMVYTNTKSSSGNQSAYAYDDKNNSTVGHNIVVGGQATQARYISYRWYRKLISGNSGGVWKIDRQTSNLKNGNKNAPYDDCPNFGWGDYFYYNNCDAFINAGWEGVPSEDQWNRIELWETISTTDVADGIFKVWYNGQLELDATGIMTCASSATNGCQIDTWMSPTLANDKGVNEWWLDDLYLDNTLARVELGNASIWSACTHKEIQIPTSWTTTSVSVTVNQGSFADCEQVYLYVVDKDGKVNQNGYLVTFAGTGCITGVERDVEANIQIYPNPTSGFLTIEGIAATDQITLTVKNMLGEEVKVNHERFSNNMKVNTEHLPTGVYLLSITHNNQESVYKIIKQD